MIRAVVGEVYWDKEIQRSLTVDFECSTGFTSVLEYPVYTSGIRRRTSTYAYGYNTDHLVKMIEDD